MNTNDAFKVGQSIVTRDGARGTVVAVCPRTGVCVNIPSIPNPSNIPGLTEVWCKPSELALA